ncbi:hypothetical protein CK203_008629 [Vitis vinifera]|uniref:Uncharacterized protein n=1 Tax=Vitis vinifera TaxID=29760 RepID=A0A438KE47_VITVI|nr:hypothetical protein CK203_008629 [Vitis vinifera]
MVSEPKEKTNFFGLAVYSIPANRPVTVFSLRVPSLSFRTTRTTSSPGNPTGNRHLTRLQRALLLRTVTQRQRVTALAHFPALPTLSRLRRRLGLLALAESPERRTQWTRVTWKTPRTAHMAQSSDSPRLSLRAPPHLRHLRLLLPLLPSLVRCLCLPYPHIFSWTWILDSGASDHLSGNKDLFSSITTTSDLPTVTLANGSQTVAKGIGLALCLLYLSLLSFILLNDQSTGKTIGIGRESQGLYHLTSDSSPAVCISTDAPLLIHNCLGHPSLSKFQKMVPCFSTLSSLPCESCQLGKHTRVSFPKRLNNRAKSPFELVHTDVWVLVGLRLL